MTWEHSGLLGKFQLRVDCVWMCCLQPTMVSLITDADHSAGAVSVAAAEAGTGLADVDVVDAPALSLSRPFLLNPAELSGPGGEFYKESEEVHTDFSCSQRELGPVSVLIRNFQS